LQGHNGWKGDIGGGEGDVERDIRANVQPQVQLPRQAAGVHIEANTSSEEVEDTSLKEEFDVVDHDQPQGEGDEPKYEEYPMEILCKWNSEEMDAQEWEEAYDNETQTKYCVNMILVSNKYYQRKCMFIAKHAKSNVFSMTKKEPMYDHRLRKRTQDGQPDHQSKAQPISAY
jgi:hypothetical protein